MEKFTASEVRYALHETTCPVSAKLVEIIYAYADRLEADEKAVPVGTILTREPDEGYARIQWADDFHFPEDTKLYTHPSPADAERLAEALRNLVEASHYADAPDEHEAAEAALAAHSAQAQPPAESVLDGVNQGLLIGTSPDGRPYAMRGTPESVAVVSAMLEHAGTSQQLTMESGNG